MVRCVTHKHRPARATYLTNLRGVSSPKMDTPGCVRVVITRHFTHKFLLQ